MPVFEKKILDWFCRHLLHFFLPVVTVFALLARYPLLELHAGVDRGAIGIAAIAADLVPAAMAALLVYAGEGKQKGWKAAVLYALILALPTNVFSSVIFRDMETLAAGVCLFSIYFMGNAQYIPAFGLYALACFGSPYSLLLLPYFLFCYIRREAFSVLCFAFPLAGAVLGGVFLNGQWIPEGFGQSSLYVAHTSFWTLFRVGDVKAFGRYLPLAVVITLLLLMAGMYWLNKKMKARAIKAQTEWYLTFLSVLISGMFFPGLGRGEMILSVILAFLLAFHDIRLLVPALLLELVCLIPQASTVYGEDWMAFSIQGLSVIRMGICLFYLWFLWDKIVKKAGED